MRIKKRPTANLSPTNVWKRQRAFLRREALQLLVIELLTFALLAALSIWSFRYAVEAMRLL